jgi:phospholipase B-like protein
MRRYLWALLCLLLAAISTTSFAKPRSKQDGASDSRLAGAFRRPVNHGWTYVHLAGAPSAIGFQHGYLLAPEIADALGAIRIETTHDNGKDWAFFRDAAQNMMWPHIEPEYREEMQGIADGANAAGVKLDLWDVVALNGFLEWSYYVAEYDKQHAIQSPATAVPGDHCSAFVATGSYTKDGRVVIAHNNWSSYIDGERWTIIFDVVPAKGQHFIMDGFPGLIHSGDDFSINSAGIVITETTITGFHGYDPNGIPEFVRARKAMQYSQSIDDFARIMGTGNNGGYANTWLVADTRRNEIASLELGLKNVTLQRSKDGYFVGANFPINGKLTREETNFDIHNPDLSANARHVRWEQLMAENKGKIDLAAAERFETDHYDAYSKKVEPSEHTLCGHVDLSPRGMGSWQPPYGIAGTVQNKATTAAMAEKMQLVAAAGHACGIDFKAKPHLQAHPEFDWEKSVLRDMDSQPWTEFEAAK